MEMLIALGMATLTPSIEGQSKVPDANSKVAATCFFQYEETGGMNKICYYDCLGSPAAITISSVQLCPLSITR